MIKDEVLKHFSGKNILVTGGTGLIGRQVVSILSEAGAALKIVSLDRINLDNRVEHIFGDLASLEFCKQVVKGMDFVFHLAGVKGSSEVTRNKPASFFVPLLMMNTNILEACRVHKVERIVYTSSIGAYASAEVFREEQVLDGSPMDTFPGWAKRMAELQIQAYRIQYGLNNFYVVRPANVYGPGDNFDPLNAMVIPSLIYRIHHRDDPVVVWGDGTAVRDFVYSRDVAEGIILTIHYGRKSPFLNLGSGRECSIRQLVETLRSFLDFNYRFDASKSQGFSRRIMDISLARQNIGYNPQTSLRDGLKQTWDWFTSNQQEYLNRKNYFQEA